MANSIQQLGIQITTDLKQTVESFRQLQKSLVEQKRALAEAQAATAGAAKAWKEAQASADTLRVQLALGKRELEQQAAATGKSSVEYLALKQAVKALEAELKQADRAAESSLSTFERQRAETRRLSAETARQSEARERGRRALQAEGVDVGNLGREYRRLEQEQAQAARAQAARETLGVRPFADIQADIARVRQAYADLAASGRASFGELAQAKVRIGEKLRELEAQTNGWAQSLDRVKLQLLGLGAALAGGVRFGGKGAGELAEFEKQIALISTLGDRTPEQLKPLGREIRALAQDLGTSAQGAAEATYQIVSSDVALEKSTGVLRQAIKAGIAGVTDTKTAAEVGLGVMHAYGYGVERLGRIYDVLFTTVNKGVVSFPELAQQLGDVLPSARSAGVGLETVGAAVATLTLNSVRAPQAVTALKSAILQLAAPTKESQKALDDYGIQWNGLVGTLEQIKAKNLSLDAVMKIVGDRDAANGVLVLTQDLERLKRLIGEIGNSGGAFEAAFGKMAGTDDAKIRRFNAAWEEFRRVTGEAVLAATPLLEALTRLLRAFNDLPGPIQAVAGAIVVLGGGWLVFGRTLKALGEALTLLWANFGGGATGIAAAEGAAAGAAGAMSRLRLGLVALPAAFGLVGGAIALLELAMDRFGRKSEQLPKKIEEALRQSQANLKALSSGPLDADLENLRKLYADAVQQRAKLPRQAALEQRIAEERSRNSGVEPIALTRQLAEIKGLEAQLAQLRAQMAAIETKKAELAAPLPTPTPAGGGAAPAAPGERGKASPYDAQFAAAETLYSLPPGLLKAVADVETGGQFNPKAVSPAGAQGMMQFMPGTAARFGLKDPFHAEAAIEAAGRYFRDLLKLFQGDLTKAIAAYNAGEGNVQKLGLDTVLSDRFGKGETKAYVPKVLGKLEEYGNATGYQDQAERDIKAAEERRRLAEETTRFEQEQRQAVLESAKRADEQETARLSAAYEAREITARQYYDRLDQLQIAAAQREALELVKQIQAEEALQTARAQGTEDYLKGQERIFALEQQIAAVRDRADQAAQANRLALASATREQTLAISDQLDQIKLRLLELQAESGPKLADIVIPPEQQALFRQRLQVLQDQYRDFMAQLRQAGNTEGLAKVNELITAEALRDTQAKTDQVTEFGVQAARNMQSAFADYLFDPFGQGLNGMARGFLETLRRMTAEAASAMLMKSLLGANFEKGEIGGLLGGLIGSARAAGRPATPYPKGSVPEELQVGPKAGQDPFDGILKQFETGFSQIFDGDFFKGLGTIFEGGFGGIVSALGDLIAGFFGGGSGGGGGGALGDAQTALGLASSVLGLFGGGFGGVANAATGIGNGIDAVNVSGAGASWGSSFSSGVYHKGGLAGVLGERRTLPAIAFAGAPRYHGGGIAGLRPNEVPAVLMGGPKGQREEILTADDPRHRDNLDRAPRGQPQASGGPASDTTVNVVNVLDPSLVGQYMSTKAGERLVMNVLSKNAGALQRLVSRG
jgi:TP901 family phage tail tape measure protein